MAVFGRKPKTKFRQLMFLASSDLQNVWECESNQKHRAAMPHNPRFHVGRGDDDLIAVLAKLSFGLKAGIPMEVGTDQLVIFHRSRLSFSFGKVKWVLSLHLVT